MIPDYLECSAEYRAMPDSERDAKCGCGTAKSWFVPDTLYGLDITDCCCEHDDSYKRGTTQQDKEEADFRLLRNLLRKIDLAEGWYNKLLRIFRRRRALKYYEAVNRFGDEAFWAGKARA